LADEALQLAGQLADALADVGLDRLRGGCFDTLERHPSNGQDVQFAWSSTKDFWQQEQAVLAYLVLYGHTKTTEPDRAARYLQLARETAMFWNLFFLDRDNNGIYFRTTDNGMPVIQGQYGNKGGHSISGYHAFELNFLAHLYIRAFLGPESASASGSDRDFCLYFRPHERCRQHSINVLPDFFPPAALEVAEVTVNGVPRDNCHPDNFQIALGEADLGCTVAVRLRAKHESTPR
jgi:hypothetical protein